jgi:hypothetical protein
MTDGASEMDDELVGCRALTAELKGLQDAVDEIVKVVSVQRS